MEGEDSFSKLHKYVQLWHQDRYPEYDHSKKANAVIDDKYPLQEPKFGKKYYEKYSDLVELFQQNEKNPGILHNRYYLHALLHYFWTTKQLYYTAEVLKAIEYSYKEKELPWTKNVRSNLKCRLHSYLAMLKHSYLWTRDHESLDAEGVYKTMFDDFKKFNEINENEFQLAGFEIFNDNHGNRRAFMLAGFDKRNDKLVIDIVFTGTNSKRVAIRTDLKFWTTDTESGTTTHSGLVDMYECMRPTINDAIHKACINAAKIKLDHSEQRDKETKLKQQEANNTKWNRFLTFIGWREVPAPGPPKKELTVDEYNSLIDKTIDKDLHIFIKLTGHSLGGSLATLVGYELGWQLHDVALGKKTKTIEQYQLEATDKASKPTDQAAATESSNLPMHDEAANQKEIPPSYFKPNEMLVRDQPDSIIVAATNAPAFFAGNKTFRCAPNTMISNIYHKNDPAVNLSRLIYSHLGFDSPYGPPLPPLHPNRAHTHESLMKWIKLDRGFHNFIRPENLPATPWSSVADNDCMKKCGSTAVGTTLATFTIVGAIVGIKGSLYALKKLRWNKLLLLFQALRQRKA